MIRVRGAKRIAGFVAVVFTVSGCMVGPDYERVTPDLPATFTISGTQGTSVANVPFFEFFRSAELQELIRSGVQQNLDVSRALARIEEAEARLGFVRSSQFPMVDLTGDAYRINQSDTMPVVTGKPFNFFGAGAALSFELDLWGKLRRATASERAALLSSEFGYRSIVLSLVSEIARTYFLLLDLDNRCAIADRTIENRRNATGLIRSRFKGGVVPELDVHQAEVEEADAVATRASLERDRKQAENALNILLGRAPQPIVRTSRLGDHLIAESVPVGFPAELLERRPDVVSAEEQAKSLTESIGVAEAQRLPSLSLLGTIGLNTAHTSDFFEDDSFSWKIGGSLLGPLFDWGRSKSRAEVARAQAKQAVESYKQTVLRAVREVEDSIVQISTYREEFGAREIQRVSASKATVLSRARYDDGVTAYLEVLDIERSLFRAELASSQASQLYYSSIVRLYAALGGGWDFTAEKPVVQ